MTALTQWVAGLGALVLRFVESLGIFARLGFQILRRSVLIWKRPKMIASQVHFLGNHSLAIILVAGLFVGLVLGLQGYYTLRRYGSEEALGLLVALALVRELGPVIAALLFAGRAGTSLTAEIGLMKAGEQLSALEAMAVDPIARVLGPRFFGGLLTVPILSTLFSAIGIIGGWMVGVLLIGVDPGAFWAQMTDGVDFWDDIVNGVIKSVVFGFAVTLVALMQGYESKPTPEGVARATTLTVVVGSLAVLGLDFVLTALMFGEH